eukprot:TRINITY_DN4105_c0_g1_i1.p1 TRINITY_DN4105_c0_g1~~TRINITY_DN4105_c0_g1_i1.p1  ORF type:complete len:1713 (+),score=349.96 TRINITY_DN4105_c0_g1_i1:412-5139(+)
MQVRDGYFTKLQPSQEYVDEFKTEGFVFSFLLEYFAVLEERGNRGNSISALAGNDVGQLTVDHYTYNLVRSNGDPGSRQTGFPANGTEALQYIDFADANGDYLSSSYLRPACAQWTDLGYDVSNCTHNTTLEGLEIIHDPLTNSEITVMLSRTVSLTGPENPQWEIMILSIRSNRVWVNESVVWILEVADGERPFDGLRMQLFHHYSNCSGDAVNATLGTDDSRFEFYSPQFCIERPLLMLYDKTRVSIFEVGRTVNYQQLPQIVLTRYAPPAATWFRLPALQYTVQFDRPSALFFDTLAFSPSVPQTIVDVSPLMQRLPWSEAEFNKSSQSIYLSLVLRTDLIGENPEYSVEIVALHEFRNVSGADLPHYDPAQRLSSQVCADLNEFWNGTECTARERHHVYDTTEYSLQQIEVKWRAMPSVRASIAEIFVNCSYNLECVNEFLSLLTGESGLYGVHHVLSVSTTARSILLFKAAELPANLNCSQYSPPGNDSWKAGAVRTLYTELANEVATVGQVESFFFTNNAQYLFLKISRELWELQGMERSVEICEKLEKDPDNVFLQDFASALDCSVVRMPALVDFLQIVSVCPEGTYCPFFEQEKIEVVPDGMYTDYRFDLKACTAGSFCANGVKQRCPIGFICPEVGMKTPTLCERDPLFSSTCYGEGLTAPSVCPTGAICHTSYFPPLYAPPGTIQTVGENKQRTLSECRLGDYCNLGRALSEGYDALLCPNSTYCSTPSVIEPVVCDQNGTCTEENCPIAPFCPEGTFQEMPCPAGSYCLKPDEKKECNAGMYCPSGTAAWQLCPARYTCRDPSQLQICPKGHYCPTGSTEPYPCRPLSFCPEGSEIDGDLTALIVYFVGPFFVYAAWKLYRNYRDKKRSVDEKVFLEKEMNSRPSAVNSRIIQPSETAALLGNRRLVEATLQPKSFTVEFQVENLGLKLKGSGHPVLQGVYGTIKASSVTAVMGPSGAGKTTFLTTLAGKAYYGEMTGKILVNGVEEKNLNRFKRVMGFVPQEDIMLRMMSVFEILMFSAATRLPSTWSHVKKEKFVWATMNVLGLTEIRHSLIGDEMKRGISGGQRKRVNIGMELVADPTILFLDEPTSGLDSTGSKEVCGALRRVAELGLTVVTVIHQPRYEIFTMFHEVLLLGKGGRTVYIGPSQLALGYFESLGFICPPLCNPADFLMDVIGGEVPRKDDPGFRTQDLFGFWETRRSSLLSPLLASSGASAGGVSVPASTIMADAVTAPTTATTTTITTQPTEVEEDGELVERVEIFHERETPGFLWLLWNCYVRANTQLSRQKRYLLLDNLLLFVAGFFLGVVYYGEDLYVGPAPKELVDQCPGDLQDLCALPVDYILSRSSMAVLGIGLCSVASFIRVFGDEQVVYWREASSLTQPRHTLAYFLGKDLSMLPQYLIGPNIFLLVYHTMTAPRAPYPTYWVVIFGVYYTASAFGYLVSILVPASMSQLVGVVTVFSNSMFAGGMPTYKELLGKVPPLRWLPEISFLRYALEALYIGEVKQWKQLAWDIQDLSLQDHLDSTYAYRLDSWEKNVGVLFAFGFALRIVAFLAMWLSNKNKKL